MSEEELDRLIERWAARRAPELIAQAQADALDEAHARLRARLLDALLQAASARLAGAARPEAPEPAPPPAPASSGAVLWVYGVVPAGSQESPADKGVDGHPVRLHRHAGVGALVSRLPQDRFSETALKARLEDLDDLEILARAHEAVLEAAMASGAVVPFRLCTIYSSAEPLNAMLEREAPALTAALERLAGSQELGVKAFLGTPAAVTAAGTPESGTEYLSRRRERRDAAESARESAEEVVAEIHARLSERAAAAALSRPQDRRLSGREAEMVLNAAYLVPIEGADAFRRVVEELGREHERDGLQLELTGPWPPYHFVETPEP
jgi:hypothetical protein